MPINLHFFIHQQLVLLNEALISDLKTYLVLPNFLSTLAQPISNIWYTLHGYVYIKIVVMPINLCFQVHPDRLINQLLECRPQVVNHLISLESKQWNTNLIEGSVHLTSWLK